MEKVNKKKKDKEEKELIKKEREELLALREELLAFKIEKPAPKKNIPKAVKKELPADTEEEEVVQNTVVDKRVEHNKINKDKKSEPIPIPEPKQPTELSGQDLFRMMRGL